MGRNYGGDPASTHAMPVDATSPNGDGLLVGKKPMTGRRRARRVVSLLVWLALLAGIAYLRLEVIQPYYVPSASMEPTLLVNDRVMGERVSDHVTDPRPGDIVTFTEPGTSTVLVKRVIATGGQTVDLKDGHVVVDGKALDEPYTDGSASEPLKSDVTYPVTVPKGSIWVMGDNRDDSADSRVFGPVPVANVQARILFLYWPLDEARPLGRLD